MEKFFKWLGISNLILLSLSVLLVVFIIIGIGVVAMHEEFVEKNQSNNNASSRVYSDSRKTIESFGDKRFSIEKGVWYGENTKCLFDREKNGVDGTIDYIKNYKQIYNHIYALGEKGYTKLNYETAEIIQSKDINLFSEEDIKIFEELEAGKGRIKHKK